MLTEKNERDLTTTVNDIRGLYDRYSGMLLGFITQSIDDKSQAEAQMINVFKALAKAEFHETPTSPITAINCWNDLRKFALNHLPTAQASNNTVQINLTEQQQYVFNCAYYQKKSMAAIAIQLNQTEDSIRETLKQAFAVMKNNYEN